MTAGWVAGSVRAAAMARRRMGLTAARDLAACPSLTYAVEILSHSPYGREVSPGDGLAAAERGVAATALWNLRVLAGWLPAEGAAMVRLLAAWFEIANIDEHLCGFTADPRAAGVPPFRLGSLATAWPRLAKTTSPAELRASLAASAWGDPGDESARALSLWLRVSWATRVYSGVSSARPWAAGAVALLAARERFAAVHPVTGAASQIIGRLLGDDWDRTAGLTDFARRLPPPARWALDGVTSSADLWLAEARWWARVRRDGTTLVTRPGYDRQRPLGAVALLAADAWLVRAALEIAARGGAHLEVWDALA